MYLSLSLLWCFDAGFLSFLHITHQFCGCRFIFSCCLFIAVCPLVLCFYAGFLGFLHLLVSHPWTASPLLVDPTGEVKQEGRRALQVRAGLSSKSVLEMLYLSHWRIGLICVLCVKRTVCTGLLCVKAAAAPTHPCALYTAQEQRGRLAGWLAADLISHL